MSQQKITEMSQRKGKQVHGVSAETLQPHFMRGCFVRLNR